MDRMCSVPFQPQSWPSGFVLFWMVSVGVCIAGGLHGIAQEANPSRIRVEIEPPRIPGGIRYGHWAPLQVKVIQEASASTFSGTIRVTGPNGYHTTRPLQMTPSRREKQLTVPVFCSSSLPVFRVRLLDQKGTERDRAQRRFRSVFGQQSSVVGISSAFSKSVQDAIRQRVSNQVTSDVRFVTAVRGVLKDLGRWPGLFDRVYLKRSADLAVPMVTNTGLDTPPMTGSTRLPQVRVLDSGAYDVFERPGMSAGRRKWMQNAIFLVLIVLLSGLFFCFYRPSSSWNWGLLLGLPVLLTLGVYIYAPRTPSVVRQVVSVRVSDETHEIELRDQRVALYPQTPRTSDETTAGDKRETSSNSTRNTRRQLRYPLESIRRTIPVFYREESFPERFPELRWDGAQRSFFWPSVPENGYFVLQEFESMNRSGSLSINVLESKGGITIQNRADSDLRNGWLRINGSFLRVGRIPEGSTKTIYPSSKDGTQLDTRDRYLERAFGTGRRQRIQRRWMAYVLQLYDRNQPMVIGVFERNHKRERLFPQSYGHVRFAELLIHRFQKREESRNE